MNKETKRGLGSHLLTNLTRDQAEAWQRLPYIVNGYRSGGTYFVALWSAFFSWHNETVNVWTVMLNLIIGTILFASLVVPTFDSVVPLMTMWLGLVVFSFFSLGQHSFICISPDVATFWRRMDMSSLLLLHTTMTFSTAYYIWSWMNTVIITSLCGSTPGIIIYETASVP